MREKLKREVFNVVLFLSFIEDDALAIGFN
jgi:hypothetical protein